MKECIKKKKKKIYLHIANNECAIGWTAKIYIYIYRHNSERMHLNCSVVPGGIWKLSFSRKGYKIKWEKKREANKMKQNRKGLKKRECVCLKLWNCWV